jgi:hypothetical protein
MVLEIHLWKSVQRSKEPKVCSLFHPEGKAEKDRWSQNFVPFSLLCEKVL